MAITDPITGAETLGVDLIDLIKQVCPDPKAQAQLVSAMQDKIISVAQASDQAQLAAMTAEAQTKGLLNKPHLILAAMCLFAIGFDLVLTPLVVWLGYGLGHPFPAPPKLDTGELQALGELVLGGGALHLAHAGYKSWLAAP